MDFHFQGKIAIVTAAGRGIGLAITTALAEEGATVVAANLTTTEGLHSLTERLSVLPVEVDVAAPAGPKRVVDRATVYRHFPDEQALFDACTSHYYTRHPMPNPEQWAEITRPEERLRTALAELYAWYAQTEQMLRSVPRQLSS